MGWVGGNFKNCKVWDLGEIKFVGLAKIKIYGFCENWNLAILKFVNVAKLKFVNWNLKF